MNAARNDVHFQYKMTVHVHLEHLYSMTLDSQRLLDSTYGQKRLELHADDPKHVPKQKLEFQDHRDDLRGDTEAEGDGSGGGQPDGGGDGGDEMFLSPTDPVPENWGSSVLCNRRRKRSIANLLAATAAVYGAKKLVCAGRLHPDVTVHGAELLVSQRLHQEWCQPCEVNVEVDCASGAAMLLRYDERKAEVLKVLHQAGCGQPCADSAWSITLSRQAEGVNDPG